MARERRLLFRLVACLAVAALLGVGVLASHALFHSLAPEPNGQSSTVPVGQAPRRVVEPGLFVNDPRAFPGYTLFAPTVSTDTYLIDMEGRIVRTWKSDCLPGQSAYLLENGHLLRAGMLSPKFGFVPGFGGRVQEFTWDGELVWDFRYVTPERLPHHDICPLPNGNVLLIVSEKKTAGDCLAAGRRRELANMVLLADCLLEVKPTGKTTGEIVWEWHTWDHLVQGHDPARGNYADVAAHPERIDINHGGGPIAAPRAAKDGADPLRAIGYVGSPSPAADMGSGPDWTHINAVAYNADLDQVMLSVREFSEVWVIDHGTTTAEAAGHTGGRYGKGGDLLYRWGNPAAYHLGTAAGRQLFTQHDAHWIPPGLPGAGHLLVFNNGGTGPDRVYSSVDEVVLPVDSQGRYTRDPGKPFGPDAPVWRYTAPRRGDFFAEYISGAQRLPNGNTLICSGPDGVLFEVTPAKEIVWKYANPVRSPVTPDAGGPVFRAYRYGRDYPGLRGKDLRPGATLVSTAVRGAKAG